MKNNINKKVIIAIFFSLIMLAGAFSAASGSVNSNTNPIQASDASTVPNNQGNYSIVNTLVHGGEGMSYNPYYNLIYITSQSYGNVEILNGTSYKVVANYTICISGERKGPFGSAYDPVNHYTYVSYAYDSPYVDAFNGTSMVYNISVPAYSGANDGWQIIFDPYNHYLYQTMGNGLGLNVLNSTSYLYNVSYSSPDDFGLMYDPDNHYIYHSTSDSNGTPNIVGYNTTSRTCAVNISLPNGAGFMVFDKYNNEYYVEIHNRNYSSVYVNYYNASTNQYLGEFPLISGIVMGMLVNNGNLYIVTNDTTICAYNSSNDLIYSANNVLASGQYLMPMAYDSNTNEILISGMGSTNTSAHFPSELVAMTPFYPSISSNMLLLPGVFLKDNSVSIGYGISNSLSSGQFYFHNYAYNEKILNPTSIVIGANSIHAPNVILSFKVSPGIYNVVMANDNMTSVINQTSPVNGYINVTYNPSTMPLDPTFSVEEVNCIVPPAPAPPLPPGGPISVITHPVKYFDYSIWTILMWVGIIAIIGAAVLFVVRRR